MTIDPLFGRFVSRLRKSRNQKYANSSSTLGQTTGLKRQKFTGRGSGMFNGANNFILNHPTFIDRTQIIQNFVAGKPGLDPVLERIVPYTDLDATMDSSARFPPPSCHPGTRLAIGKRLFDWLINYQRQCNMIWLHGPAGTGKSAVAQTFAERCAEEGRLGASFFFSRPNNRNNPDTVIPSLVYQLALSIPKYKSLVTAQLTSDPELLRKARPTLFKKLIVEPLTQLQNQKRKRIREPLLVVLDGLDECEGEDAQRDIIKMISEVVQLKQDFPLVWLICSRPEAHLKYLFSRPDLASSCGREELVIDAESIADVDLYLRDGLIRIRDHFSDVTTPTWPSKKEVTELSKKASGHFAFASTSLRYIGDPTYAAPMARLDDLLAFLAGLRVGSSNPLKGLDALYTHILLDVPNEVLSAIHKILGFFLYVNTNTVLAVCNFFSIDQTTFYHALRRLHSVIDVPTPEATPNDRLHFYHASFEDYLRDPSRSGQFAITKEKFWLDFAKTCLSWYKIDLTLFHATDGPKFDASHSHGILPGLSWVSDNNRARISYRVAEIAERWCWFACKWSWDRDEALISHVQQFDFRYIRKDGLATTWGTFVTMLWGTKSLKGIIRIEPHSEVDLRLLGYMKLMIEPTLSCRPARFPLTEFSGGQYFLLGYDSEAIICWTTGRNRGSTEFGALNYNEAPSEEQIEAYQAWLIKVEDNETGDTDSNSSYEQ